jgi:hypothetical protein
VSNSEHHRPIELGDHENYDSFRKIHFIDLSPN